MDLIDITHKEASAIINNELMGRISEGSGCLNPEYQYLGIDTDEGLIGFWVVHYTRPVRNGGVEEQPWGPQNYI